MNLRSSIAVTAAMLVAHPTAAQDHRFEADPVVTVRENFVACEVLSRLQRGDHRQDQRRPAQSDSRPRTANEACTARQLYESDVSRRSHGVRSQATADVATDPRRDCQKSAMKTRTLLASMARSARPY